MIALPLASQFSKALLFLFFFLSQDRPLRFEVTSRFTPASGRLFVVLGDAARPEPRTLIDDAGQDAMPILARDVHNFGSGSVAAIDRTAETFPAGSFDVLEARDYYVQAVLHSNTDLKSLDAPGTQYSEVQRIHIDPRRTATVKLELTNIIPEQLPPDDEYIRYVRIRSNLLTAFHKRPIFLRAAVILPKDYAADTTRRYPLRIHIGGYGTRFTAVRRIMTAGSEFRTMWLAADTPRMIYLQLDGDGPFGDPYQVNSDNNGPYGDAITRELIPYVEHTFRGIAQPYARMLDGQSTGGWVSLALKIFYPDFFNAVWSSCPDGVDLRGFQLINIYRDDNAYTDDQGMERASKRNLDGSVEFTIRRECQMENVIGLGNSWTMSGQQWGAWNAVYGPRGRDGRPVPLWDPKTGKMDRSVVPHWKKYDLRLILEENWKTLGPKLREKIHISVGESDNYFLNNAVHMLDDFLRRAVPSADAHIVYGAGQGHCWSSITEAQMMNEMAAAARRR
jgi:hypothetical protein